MSSMQYEIDKIVAKSEVLSAMAETCPTSYQLVEKSGILVPEWWSDNAAAIAASRYANLQLEEGSAVNICLRIATGWVTAGIKSGHFDATKAVEMTRLYANIMLMQLAAPNSPQWFNAGIYGAGGRMKSSGNWVFRPESGAFQPEDAWEYPQVHACFINEVQDKLVGEDSIDDLWTKETKIFKHGSGSGANMSRIRQDGAPLSGGGTSSGLMSFLKVGDSNAGAIKSGGTTRRAALMRTLDIDHPDIIDFIRWKRDEEAKVAYLAEGSKIVTAAVDGEQAGGVSPEIQNRIQRMKEEGIIDGQFAEMDTGWTSDAYRTVDGQNSNNSIMVTDEFMRAVDDDADWDLTCRVTGEAVKSVPAREIWDEIAESAWLCADPAVQYRDTINRENTAKNTGEIEGSNPCSEYVYLNNTACNLASINLAELYRFQSLTASEQKLRALGTGDDSSEEGRNIELWQLAFLMTVILDVSVDMASYPTAKIAEMTYRHRTLGLGFTALGEWLAILGAKYDSDVARTLGGVAARSIYSGALEASVCMGEHLGRDQVVYDNEEHLREVIGRKISDDGSIYEGLLPRNMQLTNVAPTGTISFVMDAGSTGIEPVYALKTWKTLSEGGGMEVVAPFVQEAVAAVIRESDQHEALSMIEDGEVPLLLKGVLATANTVSWQGHVDMMAAVQKYVCGAISKTVNLPEYATIDDIKNVYKYAHEEGVKCISIYRDKSKLSQPMNEIKKEKSEDVVIEADYVDGSVGGFGRGERESLPAKRKGYTQKVKIDSQSMYIQTGEYADGTLGEIFLSMGRQGGAYGGMLGAFAKAVSIGLQYGVPLSVFCDAFIGERFQPSGFVFGHDDVKMCTSPVDLLFKDLENSYGNINPDNTNRPSGDGDSGGVSAKAAVSPTGAKKANTEPCPECGGFNMVSTGTCSTCKDCGATTGCA